jgi:uncharacterized protein
MRKAMQFAWVGWALLAGAAAAQDAVDAKLLAEINRIRAIDNHSHADAVDASRPDRWKAGNPLGESRYPDVVPLARGNPEWRLAWKGLYGYAHADAELPHLQTLLAAKRQALKEGAAGWPAKVLDASGVDIALVNAVKLGPGLDSARFRWVPYADPLIYPFATGKAALLYSGGDVTLESLLKELGLGATPASFAEYRTQVLEPTIARWKKQGAVAVKFLSAYRRDLDFQCASDAVTGLLFSELTRAGNDPQIAGLLEGQLFCHVAALAGAQGLAVHIHTGNGDGPYFNNRRADPGLLEDALNDKMLRKTNFVLLHGGWPYHLVTQAMLDKPNTYADFSAQTFYLTTHALSEVLRGWLSWHPEKVMFGSDAYSDVDSPLVDWEEKEWLMTFKARRALAVALTAMLNNQEITRERASEIARMVLRDNAARLYGLAP